MSMESERVVEGKEREKERRRREGGSEGRREGGKEGSRRGERGGGRESISLNSHMPTCGTDFHMYNTYTCT